MYQPHPTEYRIDTTMLSHSVDIGDGDQGTPDMTWAGVTPDQSDDVA
jgi:hypothetical protein